ncbi:AraC family transcriptional regulator [Paenibacillus cremeus]
MHIAQVLGINDLSHFNKLFKQYMKLTPRQYQIQFRNRLDLNQLPMYTPP